MANAAFLLLAAAIEDEEERHELMILRREIRDGSDPLNMPEDIFRGIYRLSRELAHDWIVELAPHLQRIQRAAIAIPEQLKCLVALQFLSQGSYQKCIGQNHNLPMSQSSVSRCLSDVCQAMHEHMAYLIKFPTSVEEKAREKLLFVEVLNGFPGIIGAIDCTHVAIQAPSFEDPQFPGIVFLNRKGFYSINVQIICNAELKILAINARYPGSVHDSAIWTTSVIQRHMQEKYTEGDRSSWLIGDSGYPLQPWLMTPFTGPDVNARNNVRAYNTVHIRCRNVIERLNGVLKSRFRCLLKHRVLHYDPVKAGNIINTCAILHNLCIARGDVLEENELEYDHIEVDDNNDIGQDDGNNRNLLQEGRNTRERILTSYF